MSLNAPTFVVFIISLVLFLVSIVAMFVSIPFVSAHAFWVAIASWVVLAAGNILKGL